MLVDQLELYAIGQHTGVDSYRINLMCGHHMWALLRMKPT